MKIAAISVLMIVRNFLIHSQHVSIPRGARKTQGQVQCTHLAFGIATCRACLVSQNMNLRFRMTISLKCERMKIFFRQCYSDSHYKNYTSILTDKFEIISIMSYKKPAYKIILRQYLASLLVFVNI